MVQQTDAKGKAEVSYNFEADIIHYNLNDHSNGLYKKTTDKSVLAMRQ